MDVASGLALHCLPMSHKKDARVKWDYHSLFLWCYLGGGDKLES